MKYIYSILMLVSLLFVGTACEDDYRDMVFFTGDAPIYQVGTCSNLLSGVNLYLTKPDGIVVGVDGGDNNYSITSSDNAVATAVFVQNENGYQRMMVTPKTMGNALITVRDGNGASALLSVKVDDCVKKTWVKTQDFIAVQGDVTDEKKQAIMDAFVNFFTVKIDGYYELIPDDEGNTWGGGALRVYPDKTATVPLVGQYEEVPATENQPRGFQFTYGDEVHLFHVGEMPDASAETKLVSNAIDFWEDVTDVCPVDIPAGCKVYHIERLYIDYSYNGG